MDELTDDAPITPSARPAPSRDRTRRWVTSGVAVVVFCAVGALLVKGLSDATLFFRNADEAVAERDSLGDRRFSLQGLVVEDSVDAQGDLVLFTIEFNEVRVDVAHEGAPPQLFQEGIPVVLEGHFVDAPSPAGVSFVDTGGTAEQGYHFASDRILVKHDENYEADNAERLDDGRRGAANRSSSR